MKFKFWKADDLERLGRLSNAPPTVRDVGDALSIDLSEFDPLVRGPYPVATPRLEDGVKRIFGGNDASEFRDDAQRQFSEIDTLRRGQAPQPTDAGRRLYNPESQAPEDANPSHDFGGPINRGILRKIRGSD